MSSSCGYSRRLSCRWEEITDKRKVQSPIPIDDFEVHSNSEDKVITYTVSKVEDDESVMPKYFDITENSDDYIEQYTDYVNIADDDIITTPELNEVEVQSETNIDQWNVNDINQILNNSKKMHPRVRTDEPKNVEHA